MKTLVALAASAVVFVGLEARAGAAPDAWITTKTKIALVTQNHLSTNGVHVDTVDGRITLYGRVATEREKLSAATVAAGIDGARGVRNLLQVVPAVEEQATSESDDHLKQRIAELLKEDRGLDDSTIMVKSVDRGVVLLAGTAKTLSAHLRALETAGSAVGVRSVSSEVTAPQALSDVETSRIATDTQTSARDTWTTAEVKFRLLADSSVPALDVNVDTYRGVVSLFGVVPTSVAKLAAVADARKVDAVLSVNDELQVVAPGGRPVIAAKDDAVEHALKANFKTHPEFKHVDVAVKNGAVHLTGTVASSWERLYAATSARGTQGVRSVDDDLHLDPQHP